VDFARRREEAFAVSQKNKTALDMGGKMSIIKVEGYRIGASFRFFQTIGQPLGQPNSDHETVTLLGGGFAL
jgi:hypothetical protein